MQFSATYIISRKVKYINIIKYYYNICFSWSENIMPVQVAEGDDHHGVKCRIFLLDGSYTTSTGYRGWGPRGACSTRSGMQQPICILCKGPVYSYPLFERCATWHLIYYMCLSLYLVPMLVQYINVICTKYFFLRFTLKMPSTSLIENIMDVHSSLSDAS